MLKHGKTSWPCSVPLVEHDDASCRGSGRSPSTDAVILVSGLPTAQPACAASTNMWPGKLGPSTLAKKWSASAKWRAYCPVVRDVVLVVLRAGEVVGRSATRPPRSQPFMLPPVPVGERALVLVAQVARQLHRGRVRHGDRCRSRSAIWSALGAREASRSSCRRCGSPSRRRRRARWGRCRRAAAASGRAPPPLPPPPPARPAPPPSPPPATAAFAAVAADTEPSPSTCEEQPPRTNARAKEAANEVHVVSVLTSGAGCARRSSSQRFC